MLGLFTGLTYGLLAVGLVLVYRSSRFVNFAHGSIGVFGAAVLGRLVVGAGLPYWVAFPARDGGRRGRRRPGSRSASCAGCGDRSAGHRHDRHARAVAVHPDPRAAGEPGGAERRDVPEAAGPAVVHLGAHPGRPAFTAMLLLTPLLLGRPRAVPRRTRHGLAIRAAADEPDAARSTGSAAPPHGHRRVGHRRRDRRVLGDPGHADPGRRSPSSRSAPTCCSRGWPAPSSPGWRPSRSRSWRRWRSAWSSRSWSPRRIRGVVWCRSCWARSSWSALLLQPRGSAARERPASGPAGPARRRTAVDPSVRPGPVAHRRWSCWSRPGWPTW